jgi:hypothetical protein
MSVWWTIPLRLGVLACIAALMLVPTGMCICCEDDQATEKHEPGCPEVRKLDRPSPPQVYEGDATSAETVTTLELTRPTAPPRAVEAVAHGPPRGQPIYLAQKTLLI